MSGRWLNQSNPDQQALPSSHATHFTTAAEPRAAVLASQGRAPTGVVSAFCRTDPTALVPPFAQRSTDGGGPYSWTPTNGGPVPGGKYSRGAVQLTNSGALYGEFYSWQYRLPPDVGCTRCVLQARVNAWGPSTAAGRALSLCIGRCGLPWAQAREPCSVQEQPCLP